MCAGAASTLLAHLNVLLAMYGGAGLVACGALFLGEGGGAEEVAAVATLPAAVRAAGFAPAAAPLLLILAHLVVAAQRASRTTTARGLLLLYSVCCLVLALAGVAGAGWAAADLAAWLAGAGAGAGGGARGALTDQHLRGWLRPLLPLLATDELLAMLPSEDVRPEVAASLCAGALLPPLLLLLSALALCARPRHEPRTSQLRRSSSVYYESSAPFKVPLDDPAAWQ